MTGARENVDSLIETWKVQFRPRHDVDGCSCSYHRAVEIMSALKAERDEARGHVSGMLAGFMPPEEATVLRRHVRRLDAVVVYCRELTARTKVAEFPGVEAGLWRWAFAEDGEDAGYDWLERLDKLLADFDQDSEVSS